VKTGHPAPSDDGGSDEYHEGRRMEPTMFRIVLRGRLSERFASAFDGMTLEPGRGETALVGSLDQAQLYGVLERVRDFGLELVRVEEASQ
jgi:hypothetical protein